MTYGQLLLYMRFLAEETGKRKKKGKRFTGAKSAVNYYRKKQGLLPRKDKR